MAQGPKQPCITYIVTHPPPHIIVQGDGTTAAQILSEHGKKVPADNN